MRTLSGVFSYPEWKQNGTKPTPKLTYVPEDFDSDDEPDPLSLMANHSSETARQISRYGSYSFQ